MFEAAFWTAFGYVTGAVAAMFTIGAVATIFLIALAALPTKRPRGWQSTARIFNFPRKEPDDAA